MPRYRAITGSSTTRQPSALWTLPGRKAHRSASPSWFDTNTGVIAGAAEMPVVGAAFLLAMGRALARIHIEHDSLWRSPPVHLVDPLAGQIGESDKVLRGDSATSSRIGP